MSSTKLREEHKSEPAFEIDWKVAKDNVGMNIARRADEIPASLFQAVNPIYIMLLGLVFTALWTFLGTHGLEPSTPLKFAMGLLQLGLGLRGPLVWNSHGRRPRNGGHVVAAVGLSSAYHRRNYASRPSGLAMITKLSPARLVSTVMGGWFLATAVSQFLAGMIAQFTRVGDEEAAVVVIPPPAETVHIYGKVYGMIAIAAGVAAIACFCLVPLLKKWMHEGEEAAA